MQQLQIKINSTPRIFYQLNQLLTQELNLPMAGEGTYIKYSGGQKWSHVKLRINKIDEQYNRTQILNSMEKEFPAKYLDEIKETLELFINHYEGVTGEIFIAQFELLDATHHPSETGMGNFQFAATNAILNAFDASFHEPNRKAVQQYITRQGKI
jgi:hypothetical protein